MYQKVQKKLIELNMVSKGDCILVGVSGGADSVALLLLLHGLKEQMEYALEVIHVEHGIRGKESVADATFVKKLCEDLQVPCHEVSVDVPAYCEEKKVGTEEAARILRYEVFAKLAQERNGKVALAHHMDDNAETVLFQMVRGSSLAGLCGMQPVRTDENGVVYIRPLLSFGRSEIEAFLEQSGQKYCTDSTNGEVEYQRNFIRHEVIPKLNEVNSQAVSHIYQSSSQLSLLKDFLEKEVKVHWDRVAKYDKDLCLDIKELMALHPVLQQEIIYQAIAKVAGVKKDISAVHVKDVLSLCENQSGKEAHLPYGIVAKKEYDRMRIFIEEEKESVAEIFVSDKKLEEIFSEKKTVEIPFGNQGEVLAINIFSLEGQSAQIPQKPYTKWLDYDKIRQGFCIRMRQSGDYFISDVLGHHKKLKQYFIDEKIPSSERERMWLLAQGHTVLWLIGGRISEHIKVTEDTKTVIELKYVGGA